MSNNTRPSILVDSPPTDENGLPILGTPEPKEAPAPQPTWDTLAIPDDVEGVDERYRGKTAKDIIDMHKNAERKISEQGSELHTWRNLVNELSTQQVLGQSGKQTERPTDQQELDLSSDDLLTDPVKTITKVVEHSLNSRQPQQPAPSGGSNLLVEYPEMATLGEDFVQWVYEKPSRALDAQRIQQGDEDAARRVLDSWREVQELRGNSTQTTNQETATPPAPPPDPTVSAQQATTEPGGAGGNPAPAAPTMTANDIVEMIIKNPDRYRSPQFQEQIRQAAEAGTLDMRVASPHGYIR